MCKVTVVNKITKSVCLSTIAIEPEPIQVLSTFDKWCKLIDEWSSPIDSRIIKFINRDNNQCYTGHQHSN